MNYKAVADAETKVWQIYYKKDITALFAAMKELINAQFGETNPEVAHQFVIACMKFAVLPQGSTIEEYNTLVLPSVISAYQVLKQNIHAKWDAKKVATADLSWWVARRQKDTENPEIVGNKMADYFQLLYGKNNNYHYIRAAYLRALAARYRDQCQDKWGGVDADDWNIVNSLLEQSYKELSKS